MRKQPIGVQRREPKLNNPYDQLYIYYLEGRLKPGYNIINDDFIGNWEDGDFSFLFFSRASDGKVEKLLNEQLQLTLLDKYHMTYELLNEMAGNILIVRGQAEDLIDLQADLVIANIHYDVMKRLVGSRGFFRKTWFILSGLLRGEARDIENRLHQRRARILKKWERSGIWHTFYGKLC